MFHPRLLRQWLTQIVSFVLMALMLATLPASAASTSLSSVTFHLQKSNGPLYVDVAGNCSDHTYVAVGTKQTDGSKVNGGSTRIFPKGATAGKTLDVEVGCVGKNNGYAFRNYKVKYSGSSLSVTRTH